MPRSPSTSRPAEPGCTARIAAAIGGVETPRQGVPRNSGKTLTKTTPELDTLLSRAPSISGPIEVLGGRRSWCRPNSAQSRLIANAVAAELGHYVLPSPLREEGAS